MREVSRRIVVGQAINPAKLQRAKELRRNQTEAERGLWQAVRANRLNGWHFRRQQVIDGFIVDFYCHAAALVVEVDGGVHQQQAAYDEARDQHLVARGLRVLRFTNAQVTDDLPTVLRAIEEACEQGAPREEGE